MSKARLVITAVEIEGITQAEAARRYGVSKGWVSKLITRYRTEGSTAFEPRSRRPRNSPNATPQATVDLVLSLRKKLADAGHDAGAETIEWHLRHHHQTTLSKATIHRILTRHGTITPDPKKKPRSSYIRFAAEMPNETWQSDFTHYRLTQQDGTPGTDVEIITWLDDHSRYALHISAHARITAPIVRDTFGIAAGQHGYPASVLTDNGMVYTTRFAGGRGGRNALENELRRLHITQKNSRPNHPTTCGKVERFQQTMKKWLRTQPTQPTTIDQLQALIERFRQDYNQRRPHRSLPHHANPRNRLHHPTESHPHRQPRHRHPRPRPLRPHRQDRRRHPAHQRPTPPHRHRPNPRPNPRHPARPRPRGPRHQRRDRRTPPRTHHRTQPRLPNPEPTPRNDNRRTYFRRSGGFRCLATSHCAPGRIRTCDARFRKPTLYPLSYEGGVRHPPAHDPGHRIRPTGTLVLISVRRV